MSLKPISRAGFFFHCKFYFNAEINLRKRHISILSTRNVIWTLLGGGGGSWGAYIQKTHVTHPSQNSTITLKLR